ncbi:hypothetical protein AVEN_34748-1 [Araneus ventricosus]|uniref:Chitin-binding type-2 domain-containing protein n=1 Tax=Araneus ventricosus TaxID=182803 RepID=A0A4Y2PII6_ARAVE|nr:hypothetical protein AVEN_34748-1 [Araneus ventricosus]
MGGPTWIAFSALFITGALSVSIVKRQLDGQNDAELCKDRSPSDYFRLTAEDDCRDVVRCSVQGLLALRCPSGLAFDIEKQTCDWKNNVKNCEQLETIVTMALKEALPASAEQAIVQKFSDGTRTMMIMSGTRWHLKILKPKKMGIWDQHREALHPLNRPQF